MRYASICDGIGAAHVAAPKDWECAWISEIEKFPSAVVDYHFGYKNVGDMTKIDLADPEIRNIDVLVGGPPCQAFSIAGLRQSLDDARGNITLCYAKMIIDINPKYAVFENVPGILSTKDNAFGNFLSALVGEKSAVVPEPFSQRTKYWKFDKSVGSWTCRWPDAGCVYGPIGSVAWRVMDAQYFGLAQRRRRVFAIRCPRNGSDPAQILFEFGGVRRDIAPSRETWEENPGNSGEDTEREGDNYNAVTFQNSSISGFVESEIAQTPRCAAGGNLANIVCEIAKDVIAFDQTQITSKTNRSNPQNGDPCHTIAKGAYVPVIAFSSKDYGADMQVEITPTCRAMNHDRSHANGGGQLAVAFGIDEEQNINPELMGCMKARITGGGFEGAVAFTQNQSEYPLTGSVIPSIGTNSNASGRNTPKIYQNSVRRITPREVERLFEYPDDYTLIPTVVKKVSEKSLVRLSKATGYSVDCLHQNLADYYRVTREHLRNIGVTPDGSRYKVLGNSMAIPCMRFILNRIQEDHGYEF